MGFQACQLALELAYLLPEQDIANLVQANIGAYIGRIGKWRSYSGWIWRNRTF